MIDNKRIVYWALNILPTVQLVSLAADFQTAYHLRNDVAPLGLGVSNAGSAWAVYLALGSQFPLGATLACTLMGLFAAVGFRSRWGASTASALTALMATHFLVVACVS